MKRIEKTETPPPYNMCANQSHKFVNYPPISSIDESMMIPSAPIFSQQQISRPILNPPIITAGSFIAKIDYEINRRNEAVGIYVVYINKNVVICKIDPTSPLACSELKIGDQILEINKKVLQNESPKKIRALFLANKSGSIIVKSRPYHKIFTLLKDSNGKVGLTVKKGMIISVNSASEVLRKELLGNIIIEVNGVSTIGFSDSQLERFCDSCVSPTTLTIIPIQLYDHMRLWNASHY
ncbi:hypothetical protein MXB_1400 [Myxobolus squamalis]|nr:hypothetical protein MXB_1400 [Myxobolus squamalis]